MMTSEAPLTIGLGSGTTTGVCHLPREPRAIGVLFLTNVHQTRIGPHRQNVVLARRWSADGFPVLRFDYAGHGDSKGPELRYDAALPDVRRGIDTLMERVPRLVGVVLWGICAAGSAAAGYALADERVKGIIVANPPISGNRAELRAAIQRQLLKAPRLTRPLHASVAQMGSRLLSGLVAPSAPRSRRGSVSPTSWAAAGAGSTLLRLTGNDGGAWSRLGRVLVSRTASERFFASLDALQGDCLFLLSDDDRGASAFIEKVLGRRTLAEPLREGRRTYYPIPGGGHTFPRRESLEEVARVGSDWLAEVALAHK